MGGASSINLTLNNSKTLHQRFKPNYILGKGGFSTVFHSNDTSSTSNNKNNIVAIKQISIKKALSYSTGLSSLFEELNALKVIEYHEFIISIYCAYRYKSSCYLVMTCLSGDLRHFLKLNGPISQKSAIYIIACLSSALNHIHKKGIIHRDIKPENIGLDALGRPYLTDFGISMVRTPDNPLPISRSSSGTLPYLAPEVLAPGNYHSIQSDYWSLGVVAFELIYNRRPFEKHCPTRFIHYVASQYREMWELMSTNSTISLTEVGGITRPIELKVAQFQDNTIPLQENLIVPMPMSRYTWNTKEDVSISTRSLIQGLLDIRITKRFGSEENMTEYLNHECFLQYSYDSSSKLSSLLSPLLDDDSTGYLSGHPIFHQQNTNNVCQFDSDEDITYAPDVSSKLDNFFYLPSTTISSSSSTILSLSSSTTTT